MRCEKKKRKEVIPLGFVAWRGGEADLEARGVAGDGGNNDADELALPSILVFCFFARFCDECLKTFAYF